MAILLVVLRFVGVCLLVAFGWAMGLPRLLLRAWLALFGVLLTIALLVFLIEARWVSPRNIAYRYVSPEETSHPNACDLQQNNPLLLVAGVGMACLFRRDVAVGDVSRGNPPGFDEEDQQCDRQQHAEQGQPCSQQQSRQPHGPAERNEETYPHKAENNEQYGHGYPSAGTRTIQRAYNKKYQIDHSCR